MIAFFVILLLLGAAAEWFSLRHALDGVEYDCRLSKSVAEPEETVELISILTNRKRRFVPFLRWSDNVPAALRVKVHMDVLSATEHRGSLRQSAYLMPRQRLTRRTPFTVSNRGRYVFWGAELSGGDFLGISERGKNVTRMRELIVLPKALNADFPELLPGGLLGDLSVNRFLYEDPMLTLGFREYTGREPMKQIAWNQSASAGRLMVKVPDHTTERSVTVLLNVATSAFGSYGDGLIETCFSLTRAVCEALEEARIPYTFLSNMFLLGDDTPVPAADGLGAPHLNAILESMGRALCKPQETLWALLDRAAVRTEEGRAHILITPTTTDYAADDLTRLELRAGTKAHVIVAEPYYSERGAE